MTSYCFLLRCIYQFKKGQIIKDLTIKEIKIISNILDKWYLDFKQVKFEEGIEMTKIDRISKLGHLLLHTQRTLKFTVNKSILKEKILFIELLSNKSITQKDIELINKYRQY